MYVKTLYDHTMRVHDAFALSGNIAILAVFYCFVGAMLSYVLFYLFEEFTPEWQDKSVLYQLADVSLEVVIIALSSFWLTFAVNRSAPVFHVRADLAGFVDTYTTGLFFMFAVFMFLHGLTAKLTFLYETHISLHFDRIFPNAGSVLGMNLRWE